MKPGAWLLCGFAGLGAMICVFACGKHEGLTSPSGSSPAIHTMVFGAVSEPGGLGLPNAEVTIIGGATDGQTTITGPGGYYSFNNAADALQVRATKSGYVTSTQNISPGGRTDVTLNPIVPYPDVSGNYHVTFTASSSCQLPDDVRTRAYSAAITQDSARLTIRFSGSQFSPTTNWMEGRVYGNAVNLTFGKSDDTCFYYQDHCFAENLGDGRIFTLDGTGSGTINGSTIDTQVAGVATVSGGATCTAPDHHLVFSR